MGNIYLAEEGNISVVLNENRECECCDTHQYHDMRFRIDVGDDLIYICFNCVERMNKLKDKVMK